jgi:uncharacterized membrane-anchored protein YhcB (DUF1043 family)
MTVSEEIEQLKTQLAQIKDDKEEAELISHLLHAYNRIHSYETKSTAERLIELSEKINSEKHLATGLYHLASIYNI